MQLKNVDVYIFLGGGQSEICTCLNVDNYWRSLVLYTLACILGEGYYLSK